MLEGRRPPAEDSRLAEVLAALSLVSDMARGRPPDEAMRACLLATSLARWAGLADRETKVVYYVSLLRSVGCTATSHEYAALFGDDVAARGRGDAIDESDAREAIAYLWEAAGIHGPTGRLPAFVRSMADARRATGEGARSDCEVAAQMARRFGLDPAVQRGLSQVFERWDGKGLPNGSAGESIDVAARYAAVAYAWVIFEHDGGRDYALERLQRWSGRSLDPDAADAVARGHVELLGIGAEGDPRSAVIAAEPGPARLVSGPELDAVARAFADAVDLKTPWLHGHSTGVAVLAERAGRSLGLSEDRVVDLRRAAWLHDLGRAGVPTRIWEKATALTTAEWEQIRLHPYHTERILGRSPALGPLARLAGMHHERLDGSGYFRAAAASQLDLPARVLAAADVYQALTEDRPHRPGLPRDQAARQLEAEPLDADATRAVIEAAGQTARRPRQRPAGISDRELEVLRLLVRGQSERDIARALVVSASTVHTHVAHIYAKASVTTRAGLALFAMEHDLIRPGEWTTVRAENHLNS